MYIHHYWLTIEKGCQVLSVFTAESEERRRVVVEMGGVGVTPVARSRPCGAVPLGVVWGAEHNYVGSVGPITPLSVVVVRVCVRASPPDRRNGL